jgi:hypothetical protein
LPKPDKSTQNSASIQTDFKHARLGPIDFCVVAAGGHPIVGVLASLALLTFVLRRDCLFWTFPVHEEKKALMHSMFVSLFPNWLGQTQPRVARIERLRPQFRGHQQGRKDL